MTAYQPDAGLRAALTAIDVGEAEVIVTPDAQVADWAERHGYRIVRDEHEGMAMYEIRAGAEPW